MKIDYCCGSGFSWLIGSSFAMYFDNANNWGAVPNHIANNLGVVNFCPFCGAEIEWKQRETVPGADKEGGSDD